MFLPRSIGGTTGFCFYPITPSSWQTVFIGSFIGIPLGYLIPRLHICGSSNNASLSEHLFFVSLEFCGIWVHLVFFSCSPIGSSQRITMAFPSGYFPLICTSFHWILSDIVIIYVLLALTFHGQTVVFHKVTAPFSLWW